MAATSSTRSTSAPLELVHAYLEYQLLSVRVKRDLLLVDTTTAKLAGKESAILAAESAYLEAHGAVDRTCAQQKVEKQRARAYPGLVKLWEGVIASLEGIREIEQVEEDGDLSSEVEARVALAKAHRYVSPFSTRHSPFSFSC